jgi:integrase
MELSRIIKTKINLGDPNLLLPSSRETSESYAYDIREISYRKNEFIENFPIIYHPDRVKECNEMNLFLIQRFKGEFSLAKNGQKKGEGKVQASEILWSKGYLASLQGDRLDIKSVNNIAKDLKLFLDFLIHNKLRYEEVIAAPLSDSSLRDTFEMPVWKYQAHLCDRVETKKNISWGYAQRLLKRVRTFYLWSYKRGTIDALPFKIEYKLIQKKKEDSVDVLMQLPTRGKTTGYMAHVSNLCIPKVIKMKSDKKNDLQPYSETELLSLLSTDIAKKKGTYSLFLKCAYLAGFRAFEIVQIDYQDVLDPRKNTNIVVYKVGLLRKGAFPKPINITATLMQNLYEYTISETWKKRSKKHENKYGKDNSAHPLPLFINSAGERMVETAASDTISYVRKEQRKNNKNVLERTFHDLRSTFGTYLAIYLVATLDDTKKVRATLRKWMGHEDFNTTESYIDFAKALSNPSEYGAMHQWVVDIYQAVNKKGGGI